MMKDLVFQNSRGAYVGPTPELLVEFSYTESCPNYDVFGGDGVRLLLGKCSRWADDEDTIGGTYGINFYRAVPTLEDAIAYAGVLPLALKNRDFIGKFAFAARTTEEYERKLDTYLRFYSHIYDSEPGLVYVAPHCGDVRRPADDLLPFPEQELDSWTAGIAALCAQYHSGKVTRRIMVLIHSYSFPGPVIDIGDLGLLDTTRLDAIVWKLQNRYHDDLQTHRIEYARETHDVLMARFTHVVHTYGTLDVGRLQQLSSQDRYEVQCATKGLQLHDIDVGDPTLEGFEEALSRLSHKEVISVGRDYIFSGRYTSKLLGLEDKVRSGSLDGAVQIEISKPYARAEPFLITRIVSELVDAYFFGQEI